MSSHLREAWAQRIAAATMTLYHGTTAEFAAIIDTKGLKANDIGMVYATTEIERAEMWARQRAKVYGDAPMVVEFKANPDKVTDAARDGEVAHWGNVPVKQITSIFEVDEDGPTFEGALKTTGSLRFRKVGEGEYVATDDNLPGLSVVVYSTWSKGLGHHWKCRDPETLDVQRGHCAAVALRRLRDRGAT